ncbi:hypothetical protein ONZ51_g9725 [Trametes cubensis]|uniref:Uncharacterized protein n=1 Tax=Trametes cubensis TaxID=1111947 RepID=A0AAD7TKT5_9APHY|nr:hypothetical protein ONZ51_g9725 [Trametes cubensis]
MNWTLASIVFVLACGPFAVNMWNISTLGVVGQSMRLTMICSGVGLSRSCAIASDLLIIAITWWNAIRNGSLDAMRHDGPKMSLTRVMVLNGTTYFLALVLLNTLHLTLTLLSIVGLTEPVSEVTIFTDPLTAVIICRFLLALHAANHKTTDMGSNTSWLGTLSEVNLGTFNFASSAVHSMESVVASEPTEGALVDDIRLDVRRPRHTGWASDLSLGATKARPHSMTLMADPYHIGTP